MKCKFVKFYAFILQRIASHLGKYLFYIRIIVPLLIHSTERGIVQVFLGIVFSREYRSRCSVEIDKSCKIPILWRIFSRDLLFSFLVFPRESNSFSLVDHQFPALHLDLRFPRRSMLGREKCHDRTFIRQARILGLIAQHVCLVDIEEIGPQVEIAGKKFDRWI